MNPDFYLQVDLYLGLSDRATDWFIKSWKFEYNTDDWKLCRINEKILDREAVKHLRKAQEYLNG